MTSSDLNFDYLNVVIILINLYFAKLCFSPLVRTYIECINKQLLVDINWLSKAIWKSELRKEIKDVSLCEMLF